MNKGLICLLYSCVVGAFLGFCGALLQVSSPSVRARSKAALLQSRLTASWIRALLPSRPDKQGRRTGWLRFLRDFLYPIGCAILVLIFVSYVSDGELRLYMLVPLVFFLWLTLRFLSDAAYILRCAVITVTADICLTALWPLIRAGQYIGKHLRILWLKTLLSLGRKYDMIKAERRRKKEAKGFLRFRGQIVKELKIWPKSSDVSISPKLLRQ